MFASGQGVWNTRRTAQKNNPFRIAFVGAPWARRVKQTYPKCMFVAQAGANFMFASGQGGKAPTNGAKKQPI